jgi:hypothetical protein
MIIKLVKNYLFNVIFYFFVNIKRFKKLKTSRGKMEQKRSSTKRKLHELKDELEDELTKAQSIIIYDKRTRRRLCNDILQYICHYLLIHDIIRMRAVCTYWNRITRTDAALSVYQTFFCNGYNIESHMKKSFSNIKSVHTFCTQHVSLAIFPQLQKLVLRHICYDNAAKCVEDSDLYAFQNLTYIDYQTKKPSFATSLITRLRYATKLKELTINCDFRSPESPYIFNPGVEIVRMPSLLKFKLICQGSEVARMILVYLFEKIQVKNLQQLDIMYNNISLSEKYISIYKDVYIFVPNLQIITILNPDDVVHLKEFDKLKHVTFSVVYNGLDFISRYLQSDHAKKCLQSITIYQTILGTINKPSYHNKSVQELLLFIPPNIKKVCLVYKNFIVNRRHELIAIEPKMKRNIEITHLKLKGMYPVINEYEKKFILDFFQAVFDICTICHLEDITIENYSYVDFETIQSLTLYKQSHLPQLRTIHVKKCCNTSIINDCNLNGVQIYVS